MEKRFNFCIRCFTMRLLAFHSSPPATLLFLVGNRYSYRSMDSPSNFNVHWNFYEIGNPAVVHRLAALRSNKIGNSHSNCFVPDKFMLCPIGYWVLICSIGALAVVTRALIVSCFVDKNAAATQYFYLKKTLGWLSLVDTYSFNLIDLD